MRIQTGLRFLFFIAFSVTLAACGGHVERVRVETVNKLGRADKAGFMTAHSGRLTWGAGVQNIEFSFDADFPADYRAACERAATTWNNVLGISFFRFSDQTGKYSGSPDGHNVISWGKGPQGDATEQADTYLYFLGSRIIEADIDFSTQRLPYTTDDTAGAVDVESVCLHELGHTLGLAHSEDPASVMYPVLQTGDEKREPSPQDMANVRTGYNFGVAANMQK